MAGTLSQDELDEIYTFAIDLGRKAGKMLMDRVDQRVAGGETNTFEEKENAVDIVTQTDEGERPHRTRLQAAPSLGNHIANRVSQTSKCLFGALLKLNTPLTSQW